MSPLKGLDTASLKRLLVSGFLWAISGRVLTAAAGMAINAMLARLLQPHELGSYFLIVSMVTMLSMFGMLGLQRSVVQVVSDALARGLGGRACKCIKLSFVLAIAASTLLALLMPGPGARMIAAALDSELMPELMGVAAVLLIVRVVSSIFAETFRAFHDIRRAVLYNGTLVNLGFAALLVTAYLSEFSVTLRQALLLSVGVYAANGLVAWVSSRRWCVGVSRDGSIGVKELVRISMPLMVTGLTLFLISQADLWIVGAALGEKEVALYGAVVKLVQLVVIPLLIANAVLPSIVANLHARGELLLLEKVLRTGALVAGLPAALILVLIIFQSESILAVVYGDYYRGGANALVIIGIGQLINVVAGTGLIVLMMVGMQVYAMVISLTSGLVLVVGGWYAAGSFGIEGVAAMTAFTVALQSLVVLLTVRAKVGVWSHIDLGGTGALLRHFKGRGGTGRDT